MYLAEVFEDSVDPILVSDYEFVRDNFYSATLAVRDGRMFENDGWTHDPGSNLVGWVKHYLNSPITYLQCGDDGVAYANEHFQKLLGTKRPSVCADRKRWRPKPRKKELWYPGAGNSVEIG